MSADSRLGTSRARAAVRRTADVGLYVAIPALGAIAPFMVLPAVTSRFGASGWAIVAIATSVGGAGSVMSELGWGVIGPQEVARRPESSENVYRQSLATKLLALSVIGPIAVVVAVMLGVHDRLSAGLIGLGTLLAILSPAWYFIGKGRPLVILLGDTCPRVVAAGLSALVILLGAPLWSYGVGLVLASLIAPITCALVGGVPVLPRRSDFRGAPRTIRRQLVIVLGQCISTAYTSLPTTLVAAVSPPSVALFSAFDKPMRMGLVVLAGVPSKLQSWLGTPDQTQIRRRNGISLVLNAALGLVAGLVYAAIAPFAVRFLFSGTIQITIAPIILEGLLAAIICFSRGLGLSLVSVGRANTITTAIAAASVVGVTALLTLAPRYGANGAFTALICAELVGVCVQGYALLARFRSPHLRRA